jgi:hypothetical protein
MRGWWGGVGVEEAVVGMGEGDVEGVSVFTSSFYCAGAVP